MTAIISSLIGLIVIAAVVLFLVWKKQRRRKLSTSSVRRLRRQWAMLEGMQDPHRKIIDAEKIVDSALEELGYTGTFADKLRSAGPRLKNPQALWEAHKLRNRIAHDLNISFSEKDIRIALQAFDRALGSLS